MLLADAVKRTRGCRRIGRHARPDRGCRERGRNTLLREVRLRAAHGRPDAPVPSARPCRPERPEGIARRPGARCGRRWKRAACGSVGLGRPRLQASDWSTTKPHRPRLFQIRIFVGDLVKLLHAGEHGQGLFGTGLLELSVSFTVQYVESFVFDSPLGPHGAHEPHQSAPFDRAGR